ncbi:tetratricopeptide repeat protein [Hoeflea sp. TYP-13]|uniref:tetratricopeptide repeat protein n=1 Tax=Hoeflea sp. TYP-13 TaxID=3230023 RepID=UPI0034C5F7CE
MNKLAHKPISTKAPPPKLLKKIHSLQKRGKFRESRPLCDRLEAQGYLSPDLLHFHGLALRACGDLDGALVKIYAATEQKPGDALMLNSLGVVLLQMNELEAAIEYFKRATKVDRELYDPWKNLGIALRKAERYQAAQLAFTSAHHLDPSQPEPVLNIVYMLIDNRHYRQAEELMDRLLSASSEITPSLQLKRLHIAARLEDFDYITEHRDTIDRSGLNVDEQAEIDNIWAFYLQVHGHYDEAIEILEEWVNRESSHQEHCVTQLGLCYAEAGQIGEGIEYHKALLRSNPDHIAGRYNLGMLQMKNGDVAESYKNYEARWQRREFPSKRRVFDAPRWQGEAVKGKKLLVWREQGIGDEVRFASVIPDLEELGCSVTFECSPKLSPLWERSFPWATIDHEGETDCRSEEAYADFDYQIPVGSLGAIFRPSVDDFHEKQAPWIRRYHEAENRVRAQLAVKPDETLVGVCWRSSNQATSRDRYLLGSEQLEPLKTLPKARWLNVQYSCDQDEVENIRNLGLPLHHYANLDQKDDLVAACSLIGACDIVISVGVSVADLAAGLGVPVVRISSEISEIYLGTDHVPWFPTCMSLRMQPNGGDDAIADIVDRWPAIIDWAKNTATSERESPSELPAGSEDAPISGLDHEYHVPSA